MTIEALANELADGDGTYDRLKAVRIHTQVVATTAASAESVIQDLDLLNRGADAIDPAEILRVLASYAQTDADRQLLGVLAGAVSQLREVAPNLPSEQAAVLGELVGRLQGARSIDDLYSILATYESNQIRAVGEGASYAHDILRDGEETIYNPEASPVAQVAGDPGDPPQERNARAVLAVAAEDAAGAAGGAAAGAFFFGFGALPGAVGGAVGTSVTTTVSRALKWLLFGDGTG
jgi:hypothetical protein